MKYSPCGLVLGYVLNLDMHEGAGEAGQPQQVVLSDYWLALLLTHRLVLLSACLGLSQWDFSRRPIWPKVSI